MPQTTYPQCASTVENTQNACKCGASSESVWPPPVAAEPLESLPVPVRLLTGKKWLDEMLGVGLFWLWLFGLNKAVSVTEDVYITYVIWATLTQKIMPDTLFWLGLALFALTVLSVAYLGLRGIFPIMGSSFGRTSLFGVRGLFVVFACLTLFR